MFISELLMIKVVGSLNDLIQYGCQQGVNNFDDLFIPGWNLKARGLAIIHREQTGSLTFQISGVWATCGHSLTTTTESVLTITLILQFSVSAMFCCGSLCIQVCNIQHIITDIKINFGMLGIIWKSRTFTESDVIQILLCDTFAGIFWNSISNLVPALRSYLEYQFSTLNLTNTPWRFPNVKIQSTVQYG